MLLTDVFLSILRYFLCAGLVSSPDNQVIDDFTPQGALLSAKYKRSYAYLTVSRRMPNMLMKFASDLNEYSDLIVGEYGQEVLEDIKSAINQVGDLGKEIENNRAIYNLTSDASDVEEWNSFLQTYKHNNGVAMSWYGSPWLYVECYMYRRIRQIFELSHYLRNFDHFSIQKQKFLIDALPSASEIANYLSQKFVDSTSLSTEQVKQELLILLQVNLWGNRFDMAHSDGHRTKPVNILELALQLQGHVLVNNFDEMWNFLSEDGKLNSTIDIVCDNYGLELFTDLCLADFLVTFSLEEKVRFHVKTIPWFVSDTTMHDMKHLITTLKGLKSYTHLQELGRKWEMYFASDIWTVEESDFWTLPYSYNDMESVNITLHNALKKAKVVIFKGDLNYRKLLGDINWPTTTPFKKSLRTFYPSNIAAIRTVKADVISGLKPGQSEQMDLINIKWNITGEYGVIQC